MTSSTAPRPRAELGGGLGPGAEKGPAEWWFWRDSQPQLCAVLSSDWTFKNAHSRDTTVTAFDMIVPDVIAQARAKSDHGDPVPLKSHTTMSLGPLTPK